MRSVRAPAQFVRLIPVLVAWVFFALGVPAASAQQAPVFWSIQLDGGLFAPIEASGASPALGVRYCKHFTSHVQGGLLSGWTFKRTTVDAPAEGPQGSESQVELARADARLVPLMGFMQVDFTDRAWLVPYVGIGAGYEWLALGTVDHRTGQTYEARYSNMAWQTYAGLGVRLASRVRFNSELFYNGGSLKRNVIDSTGRTWREAVDVNGIGARVGLDMIFE